MNTIPAEQLAYAKGTLSGLLNFSIRSGLTVGAGCESTASSPKDADPAFRCRCGYEHALDVAIRCIDIVSALE